MTDCRHGIELSDCISCLQDRQDAIFDQSPEVKYLRSFASGPINKIADRFEKMEIQLKEIRAEVDSMIPRNQNATDHRDALIAILDK